MSIEYPVIDSCIELKHHHSRLKKASFPIINHGLYGNVKEFESSPFLLPKQLSDFTAERNFDDATNLEICPSCFFQTSGTTSRSKRIPYSDADLERQRHHQAEALRRLGMMPEDVVLTMGSPLPSISGWASVHGSQTLGATVVNTSFYDYEQVFRMNRNPDVTVIIGTPIVVKEIGILITKTRGNLKTLFPRLRTGIIFGDVLPNVLRMELVNLWGFKNVATLYGTVEADVIGVECLCRTGSQHLMLERLIIEAIPEIELLKEYQDKSYTPKPVNILDIENDIVGEVVITDLMRDILPIVRYRIGDVVQVSTATCGCNLHGPTVSVLGRTRNTIYLGDVPIYEMQINQALERAVGARVSDWRLLGKSPTEKSFDLYLLAPDIEGSTWKEQIFAALQEIRPELQHVDLQSALRMQTVSELDQVPLKPDAKAQRICLD